VSKGERLIEPSVTVQGSTRFPASPRARRLFAGWSANLFQIVLGVAQQVAFIPVFLHFWATDVLAAWLVIYAVGNLIFIADCGLQFRVINRFLAFKSNVDCDGRTAQFYFAMLWIYFGLAGALLLLLLVVTQLLPPSGILGFSATAHFDAAFIAMAAGTIIALPSNLASGLYRARGFYSRAVWLQTGAMLFGQLAQLAVIITTGSLLAVTIAYVSTQVLMLFFLIAIDAPRLFPFLRRKRVKLSTRWVVGQFRYAAPFGFANAAELALLNLPVLLVSALVSDRVAVAQWGLTRVVAGLLRTLCVQATLPLAAELGHDYATGLKEPLRNLYARGSVFVTVLASVVVSGLLPFWQDFFALWTHGAVPYDPLLAITLMLGTSVGAPANLALSFANYSNRGNLLVRSKGLQLAVFLVLSAVLIGPIGTLGAAIAIVASDLLVQFGLLGLIIMRQTLQYPFRHLGFLAMIAAIITLSGWGVGVAVGALVPWSGAVHFLAECTLWLIIVALVASPLTSRRLRDKLVATIPR
jgi:O-antigen/teichoic acid export membrane protein